MKIFSHCFFILGLAASPLVLGQSPSPSTPLPQMRPPVAAGPYVQMTRQFFDTLHKGEVGGAFDDLTRNSELAAKTDELDALKNKTRQGMDLIGGIQSWELLQEEKVGSRLVRLTYLSYGDKYPLRWLLYFYEVNKVWRLIDLRVDDSLVRMFGDQEAAP